MRKPVVVLVGSGSIGQAIARRVAAALAGACALAADPATEKPAMPGTAAAPVVYFTHDISPEGQGFEARH